MPVAAFCGCGRWPVCGDTYSSRAVKAAKYANYQRLCDTLFLGLIVTWVGTRIGIYPFYIIWSTSIRAPMLLPMFAAYYIFNTLLCLLLALHVVWTWLILQIAYITIKAGQKCILNIHDWSTNARIHHTNICPHRDLNPGPLESVTP
ncbi:hypothetical protein evm_004573 [Chilo suppressalis]|nr:hypothetical protein evm_004573 [Chilo suppressalis]